MSMGLQDASSESHQGQVSDSARAFTVGLAGICSCADIQNYALAVDCSGRSQQWSVPDYLHRGAKWHRQLGEEMRSLHSTSSGVLLTLLVMTFSSGESELYAAPRHP